ncbi:unnamed protein product [Brassica napus]|uniref:(rape) hypothetical protein n=1 Tax=Brassica napus TaxID=3708 RepID=A0A816TLF7_BRANA|nr:unnamed protein product [Brassica napus]
MSDPACIFNNGVVDGYDYSFNYSTSLSHIYNSNGSFYYPRNTTDINPNSTLPESPPLREALPLLSLSPIHKQKEDIVPQHEYYFMETTENSSNSNFLNHNLDQCQESTHHYDVTVDLHLGLPNPGGDAIGYGGGGSSSSDVILDSTDQEHHQDRHQYHGVEVTLASDHHHDGHGGVQRGMMSWAFTLSPYSFSDSHGSYTVLLSSLLQDLQQIQQHADAHVGTWLRIQKRTRVTKRDTTNGDAEAALLLLRTGLQEQH